MGTNKIKYLSICQSVGAFIMSKTGVDSMKLTANINMEQIEPFKSYLIELTTLTDYIAQKKNKTVMEQRVVDVHREFMKGLER